MNNPTLKLESQWHEDWQSAGHVRLFDSRSALSDRQLIAHYRAFNDVLLLDEALFRNSQARLVEVGCATGEFYRYVKLNHPRVRYCGVDLSRAAIERAQQKYPEGSFFVNEPEAPWRESFRVAGLPEGAEVIYAKDVVHHQTDPFGFLGELLELAFQALVVRLRTRDVGQTVLDPELSCQYHYNGWMPYLVLNLQETLEFVLGKQPRARLVVRRNRMILGGRENRYLPKECYLPETGTAETALAVLLETHQPGTVDLLDRREGASLHSLWRRLLKR